MELLLIASSDSLSTISQYASELKDKTEHQGLLIWALEITVFLVISLVTYVWVTNISGLKTQIKEMMDSFHKSTEALSDLARVIAVNHKEEEAHRGYCFEKHEQHKVNIKTIQEDVDDVKKRVTIIETQHGMNHPDNPIMNGG